MAVNGTLLVGYDVEKTGECAQFLGKVTQLHEQLDAPCTIFAVGSCVASEPAAFEQTASHPLIDIAQHTWSHILLKTVVIDDGNSVEVIRGASLDQIEEDIMRAKDAIENICGIECLGLTGPWCYYRGLMDRPDILEILHKNGIRYTRTFGRNEKDYQPVSVDLQPFWYGPQGFPDILECMVHGWQDIYLRSLVGWANIQDFVDQMKVSLAYASDNNLVFSWCSHDWSNLREDPNLAIIQGVLSAARDLGMEILSYKQFWTRMEELRKASMLTTVSV